MNPISSSLPLSSSLSDPPRPPLRANVVKRKREERRRRREGRKKGEEHRLVVGDSFERSFAEES